jgi:hypothetical protein
MGFNRRKLEDQRPAKPLRKKRRTGARPMPKSLKMASA